MTMLHLCLLEPCDNCYQIHDGKMVEKIIEMKLQRANEFYSKELVAVIQLMLTLSEEDRPNFIQLE